MIRRKLYLCAVLAALLSLSPAARAMAQLPDFTDLAERAGKAVVNISTVKTVSQKNFRFFNKPDQEHPFEEFFDQFEKFFGPHNMPPRKQNSLGSGFVISRDGYIVTNNHVIQDADKVTIKLQNNGHEFEAKVVGRDKETDLALLKIEAGKDLPVLEFGDSDKARVGEWVVAIGNPFGLGHTVTSGIISAKGRVIGAGPFDNFLQTDASINPGNSGGPLIDMNGRVIGINTAIVPGGEGIGFAIPSSMASKIIDQLKAGKKVQRGWLGVTIQNVDENAAKALGLKEPAGALVTSVIKNDPADKAGIKTSDVIIEVDGEPVADTGALLRSIAGMLPGHKTELTIWRDNKKIKLDVTLQERGDKAVAAADKAPESEESADEIGLSLRPVTKDAEARALGLDKPRGLVVTGVKPDSVAGQEGVRPGDVILEVNQRPVAGVDQFRKIVDSDGKAKGAVMLLIKRQGRNIFITLPLEDKK
ncbi:MAG: DegQ family serine endoprotease [Desulfovibrionaceae bacterium]|nr:DegQ family serine endoprotease [Desulfovibrionaceae bacterium]